MICDFSLGATGSFPARLFVLTIFKFFCGGYVNRIVERSIRFTNRVEKVSDTEILAVGRLQFVLGGQLLFWTDFQTRGGEFAFIKSC